MPKFRRGFFTYAEVECDSIEEVDNMDMSKHIMDNLIVEYTEEIAPE